jgi:dTDP-L-rhamnose 4-epimerase
MKILITGGAGFVGSRLSLALAAEGHRVTILDNLSEQVHGNGEDSVIIRELKEKTNFIMGDVRDLERVASVMVGQEVLAHMAAETGTGQSMYEIARYTDVNVTGTARVLEALAKKESESVRRLVLPSSRAIYGEGKYSCKTCGTVFPSARKEADMAAGDFNVKCPICFENADCVATSEDSMPRPDSIYALTKYTQEQMATMICGHRKIDCVVLRYQNVYGPGQSLSNPYTGVLSVFSTLLINNKDITIFEDGFESRDFVFIDDVVAATAVAIQDPAVRFGVYNIGSGERRAISEVAEILKKKMMSHAKITVSGNFRLGDIRHNFADITKAKKELGFAPATSFNDGIQKFVDWVRKESPSPAAYEHSLEEMKAKQIFK